MPTIQEMEQSNLQAAENLPQFSYLAATFCLFSSLIIPSGFKKEIEFVKLLSYQLC